MGNPSVPEGSSANLTIDINKIELLEEWNREKVTDLRGLKASIVARGQLVPLLVKTSENDGRVVVVDGRRRFAALLELGVKDVLISLTNSESTGDALLDSMATNDARDPNTAYEKAITFHILSTKYSKSNEEIARSCGKTAGYVSQHLAVMKSTKSLQEALRKEQVPLAAFRLFARLDQEEDGRVYDKLSKALVSGKISCAQLEERIKDYLEAKGAPEVKKGAAAHKKNKDAAASVAVPDYDSKEVKTLVKSRNKTYMLEWLTHTGDLLKNATKKKDRDYLQGKLDGMEQFAGLQDED